MRRTQAPLVSLQAHQSTVLDSLFLPGEKASLMCCDVRGKLVLWDFTRQIEVADNSLNDAIDADILFTASSALNSIDYNASNRTFITGSDTEQVQPFRRKNKLLN
jgi:hypothetical protein